MCRIRISHQATEAAFERFRAASSLEEPDQVPLTPYLGSDFLSNRCHVSLSEWYQNPKLQLGTQIEICAKYLDLLAWPGVRPYSGGGFVELSALGARIEWPQSSAPRVAEPIVKKPEDVDKLRIPDPCSDGYMPMFIKFFKYFINHAPSSVRVNSAFCLGPFDIAVLARGVTGFMEDLYLRPELAHTMLDIATRTTIRWMETLNEIVDGLEIVTYSDDFPGLISPKHFEEFALPYTIRCFEALPKECIGVYHNDANTSKILQYIPETGAMMFHMGPELNIVEVKTKIGKRICLNGNIPPLEILLRAQSRDVEQFCRSQILYAAPGGGYCLGSGGAVAEATPIENIDAMAKVVEEFGGYPVPSFGSV